MTLHRSAVPLRLIGLLGLCASLGAWMPAQAALVLTGVGSYTLGSNGGPGATASPTTTCGDNNTGQDALEFTGAGANSIGIHAYACDSAGFISFGSRASGEGTYYVDATASVTGQITASGNSGLLFYISGGQVGAFGSTLFGVNDYQQATLSINLTIGGTTYISDYWKATVGAGGVVATSEDHLGSIIVGSTGPTVGAGYGSFGIDGGYVFVGVADGTYDISYVMASVASGKVTSPTTCRGTVYSGGGGEIGVERVADVANVVGNEGGDGSFDAYCGAGAQSGDPFPPLARALQVPEPGSIGLVAAALAALGVAGRRQRKVARA